MTDFLFRLAQRTLGVAPLLQPTIASMFAPGTEMVSDYALNESSDEEPEEAFNPVIRSTARPIHSSSAIAANSIPSREQIGRSAAMSPAETREQTTHPDHGELNASVNQRDHGIEQAEKKSTILLNDRKDYIPDRSAKAPAISAIDQSVDSESHLAESHISLKKNGLETNLQPELTRVEELGKPSNEMLDRHQARLVSSPISQAELALEMPSFTASSETIQSVTDSSIVSPNSFSESSERLSHASQSEAFSPIEEAVSLFDFAEQREWGESTDGNAESILFKAGQPAIGDSFSASNRPFEEHRADRLSQQRFSSKLSDNPKLDFSTQQERPSSDLPLVTSQNGLENELDISVLNETHRTIETPETNLPIQRVTDYPANVTPHKPVQPSPTTQTRSLIENRGNAVNNPNSKPFAISETLVLPETHRTIETPETNLSIQRSTDHSANVALNKPVQQPPTTQTRSLVEKRGNAVNNPNSKPFAISETLSLPETHRTIETPETNLPIQRVTDYPANVTPHKPVQQSLTTQRRSLIENRGNAVNNPNSRQSTIPESLISPMMGSEASNPESIGRDSTITSLENYEAPVPLSPQVFKPLDSKIPVEDRPDLTAQNRLLHQNSFGIVSPTLADFRKSDQATVLSHQPEPLQPLISESTKLTSRASPQLLIQRVASYQPIDSAPIASVTEDLQRRSELSALKSSVNVQNDQSVIDASDDPHARSRPIEFIAETDRTQRSSFLDISSQLLSHPSEVSQANLLSRQTFPLVALPQKATVSEAESFASMQAALETKIDANDSESVQSPFRKEDSDELQNLEARKSLKSVERTHSNHLHRQTESILNLDRLKASVESSQMPDRDPNQPIDSPDGQSARSSTSQAPIENTFPLVNFSAPTPALTPLPPPVPPSPTIQVSIGRLQVRGIQPTVPSAPPPRPAPRRSLDDHLKRRNGRTR